MLAVQPIAIVLPARLSYQRSKEFFATYYDDLMSTTNATVELQWGGVRWVDLPEAMQILSLSCKLAQLGNKVHWNLELLQTIDVDALAFEAAREFSGPLFGTISSLLSGKSFRGRGMDSQPSTPRRIRHLVAVELERAKRRSPAWFGDWVDGELYRLDYMNVIGYLVRYDFFRAALACRISVEPKPTTLPFAQFATSDDTVALPLREISGLSDVDNVQAMLTRTEDLARVFGDFAGLDVARKGLLSNVLVAELGRNVVEHAPRGTGWICSRRLHRGSVAPAEADTVTARIAASHDHFLEVIVSDTGPGLTHGLDDVLRRDNRAVIKERYSRTDEGHYRDLDLVDYAFDRLSSTKRDIAALIHFSGNAKMNDMPVSSGLYWIWNAARSYRGMNYIRTGSLAAIYDFYTAGAQSPYRRSAEIEKEEGYTPWCGTEIRLYLPLVPRHDIPTIQLARPGASAAAHVAADAVAFRFAWLGEYSTAYRYQQLQRQRLVGNSGATQFELSLPESWSPVAEVGPLES